MNIKEQIEVISTGSVLYTYIEHLLDIIQDVDMSLFENAKAELESLKVELESFLRPLLEDTRSRLRKDIYEAKERLKME